MGRKFIEKMCVAVPYYETPSLLDRNSRVAVVTNSKGWAYDVWDLPTFWITSGYSPKGPIVPPSCTRIWMRPQRERMSGIACSSA